MRLLRRMLTDLRGFDDTTNLNYHLNVCGVLRSTDNATSGCRLAADGSAQPSSACAVSLATGNRDAIYTDIGNCGDRHARQNDNAARMRA